MLNVYVKRDFTRSLVTKKIAFGLGDMNNREREREGGVLGG